MDKLQKRFKLNIRTITLLSIMVSLSTVLGFIKIYTLPQGGDVTLGSMVPIIFMSMVFGVPYGMFAGFLFGLLNLILDPHIYYPVQVLLDYFLAFTFLGIGGIFKKNKILAATISIFARFICHVLSGVIFFSSYANGQNSILYSVIYNGSYLGIELIITIVILYFLPIDRFKKIIFKNKIIEPRL